MRKRSVEIQSELTNLIDQKDIWIHRTIKGIHEVDRGSKRNAQEVQISVKNQIDNFKIFQWELDMSRPKMIDSWEQRTKGWTSFLKKSEDWPKSPKFHVGHSLSKIEKIVCIFHSNSDVEAKLSVDCQHVTKLRIFHVYDQTHTFSVSRSFALYVNISLSLLLLHFICVFTFCFMFYSQQSICLHTAILYFLIPAHYL